MPDVWAGKLSAVCSARDMCAVPFRQVFFQGWCDIVPELPRGPVLTHSYSATKEYGMRTVRSGYVHQRHGNACMQAMPGGHVCCQRRAAVLHPLCRWYVQEHHRGYCVCCMQPWLICSGLGPQHLHPVSGWIVRQLSRKHILLRVRGRQDISALPGVHWMRQLRAWQIHTDDWHAVLHIMSKWMVSRQPGWHVVLHVRCGLLRVVHRQLVVHPLCSGKLFGCAG